MTTDSGAEPVMIPLDRIISDPQYQPRSGGLVESHVRLLMESGPESWPPPFVAPLGDGMYGAREGFHRIEGARRLGVPALRCHVVEDFGYPEAVAANVAHGLPLSRADRKEAARWWKHEEPELSHREIGRRVGLSDKTVKAALTENQRPDDSRSAPDPVARFIGSLLRTNAESKPNARAIRREIDAYDDESRLDVATILADIGGVLVEASRPYLEGR